MLTTLLSSTLRSYESEGCEDKHLFLSCPGFTRVSLYAASYGQPCSNSTPTAITCAPANAVSQRAVETCRKKSNCLFQPAERSSCAQHVRLSYKCEPNEFHSRVACEDEKFSLSCSPNQRIAVFRASYGRTQYESMHCPQPQGVPEETCLTNYATESFMELCHGRRRCSVAADINTFAKPPCRHSSRMYLKAVYACVPKKVLQKDRVSANEPDEEPEGKFEHDNSEPTQKDAKVDYDSENGDDIHVQDVTQATVTSSSTRLTTNMINEDNSTSKNTYLIDRGSPKVNWMKETRRKMKPTCLMLYYYIG
ncbi:protein eva-1 homolog C-like [Nilaparvata lugens]|uniref:protein eva-1 homolog C-like n=1 Tax=Nilaparvata lugens TaxID=108931 RepID=UPI00193D4599|nr:protein eva-1 homolog C-like [Nilaparvata lugens]